MSKKHRSPLYIILRRVLVLAAVLGVVFCVFVGIIWFNLSSEQLKQRVVTELGKVFNQNSNFNVENVSFELAKGFELKGFTLLGPGSKTHDSPFIHLKKVTARPDYWKLLIGDLILTDLRFDGGEICVEYCKEESWNFLGVLKKKKPEPGIETDAGKPRAPKTAFLPRRIVVNNLALSFCPHCMAQLLDLEPEEVPESLLQGTVNGIIEKKQVGFTREELAGLLMTDPAGVPDLLVRDDAQQTGQFVFSATFSHPEFHKVLLVGGAGPDASKWLHFSILNLKLNRRNLLLTPKKVREQLAQIDPSATLTIHSTLLLASGEEPRIDIRGTVRQGSGRIPGYGFQLKRVAGGFHFDGTTCTFTGFQGNIDESICTLDGSFTLGGAERKSSLKGHIGLNRITLDERIERIFHPSFRPTWKKLNTAGQIGVEADVVLQDGNLALDGAIRVLGVNVRWEELPYTIDNVKGILRFTNEKIMTAPQDPLYGTHGSTSVTIATYADLTSKGRFTSTIRLEDIQFNKQLRSCLEPEAQEIWDYFQLQGKGDTKVSIEKKSEAKKLATKITITGKDARIRYHHFPYEIDRITGDLVIEHNNIEVKNLAGYHGATYITCPTGYWRKNAEGKTEFAFEFHSPSLPIDEDLCAALPPSNHQVIKDFKLSGRVAPKIKLYQTNISEKFRLEINARFLDGKINYIHFPYPFSLTSGNIYIGPGLIMIDDLKAAGNDLELTCKNGLIRDLKDSRQYDLELEIQKLLITPQFINALPAHVAKLLNNLLVTGTFKTEEAHVIFQHRKEARDDFSLWYYLNGIEFENVSMNAGMKFRQLSGDKGKIVGKAARDTPHEAIGSITLDTARFHGMKLSDIELQATYGKRHGLLNTLAKGEKPKTEFALQKEPFLKRVPGDEAARNILQVLINSGKIYDGDLNAFSIVNVGDEKDILAQLSVRNMDFNKASADLFEKGRASGIASVETFFSGDIRNVKSFKGTGNAHVREANLIKFPLFISMFQNLLKFEKIKQSYFHKIDIPKFFIENGRFRTDSWDSILMKSDIMTLRGGGSIDFDMSLDLNFSLPSFLPTIPGLSSVLRLFIDNVVGFHITGTVDNPNVKPMPLRDIIELFKG